MKTNWINFKEQRPHEGALVQTKIMLYNKEVVSNAVYEKKKFLNPRLGYMQILDVNEWRPIE